MQQPQVLSRAINTYCYKKDVAETGSSRDRNPSAILGKAQESLYSNKTGLRRFFGTGGSSQDAGVASAAPDEPEVLEIAEPSRQFNSAEDIAARVAKVRRSSMTTYTLNLVGTTAGQVEREVRRLAGLAPAFTRPSAASETMIHHAASFDAVEEMGTTGGATGAGNDSDTDADASPVVRRSYGGVGGNNVRISVAVAAASGTGAGGSGRGPVKSAFGGGASGPIRISEAGGERRSVELADVTRLSSSGTLPISGFDARSGGGGNSGGNGGPQAQGRTLRPPSLSQAFGGAAVANSAATAAAFGGGGGVSNSLVSAGSLSMPPATPTQSTQLMGQLGLMKDRKASRHGITMDMYGPPPGGSGGGSGGGGGGPSAGGTSPTTVLKLPALPSTPGKAPSGSQMGPNQASSSVADSRPPSARYAALGRGSINSNHSALPAAAAVERWSSLEVTELPANANGGGGLLIPRAAIDGAAIASGGGGGGGRWFQQSSEDVEAMLAGNEELLERIMAASGSYGSGGAGAAGTPGAASPSRAGTGTGTGSGSGDGAPLESGLLLPRLADSTSAGGAPDRATAQLQELWRVQANVEDQLARERQAIAAGRVRRASVLEDVAGQQQPRWQVSYNVDAMITHAKLGTVDASRRNELDKAHIAKLMKEQKVPAAPTHVTAAAASPVVARARRLSTVMVA